MFSSKLKRPLLALAVTAGLLAVAGPASAQVVTDNKDPEKFSVDIGTNWEATPEFDANANAVFSGDAYDNEMGIVPPVRRGSAEVMMETITL